MYFDLLFIFLTISQVPGKPFRLLTLRGVNSIYSTFLCFATPYEGSKQLRFVRPDRSLERRVDHQNELVSGDTQRRGLPDYRMHLSSHRCLEIRLLRKKQNGRLNYRK